MQIFLKNIRCELYLAQLTGREIRGSQCAGGSQVGGICNVEINMFFPCKTIQSFKLQYSAIDWLHCYMLEVVKIILDFVPCYAQHPSMHLLPV